MLRKARLSLCNEYKCKEGRLEVLQSSEMSTNVEAVEAMT